ncbi:MAG: CopG family ribbon-helix-helix protein [Cyanobacteria bacterium P01_G01_bin.54]
MTTTSFRLDQDLEGKLDDVAQSLKRSKSWIINDALRHYIEREERRQQMLRETEVAMADWEADRIVSGEAVMGWLESWGTELEEGVLV